ncbi:hypothetical protein SGM_2037 [Streptomyces griseoaurantiacus M045]|uniref:Uncharacterized protein n=1 Tax=Streptomyces griseoaurantiacus M045 TaxID=996637 RepID=F3NFX3_9ACTN|nr:hypothetical protein SGM_2037 [Streptomyces griseoaurantiacus M045]
MRAEGPHPRNPADGARPRGAGNRASDHDPPAPAHAPDPRPPPAEVGTPAP